MWSSCSRWEGWTAKLVKETRERSSCTRNGGDLCAQLHHGGIQVLAAAVISLDALPDAGIWLHQESYYFALIQNASLKYCSVSLWIDCWSHKIFPYKVVFCKTARLADTTIKSLHKTMTRYYFYALSVIIKAHLDWAFQLKSHRSAVLFRARVITSALRRSAISKIIKLSISAILLGKANSGQVKYIPWFEIASLSDAISIEMACVNEP